MINKKEDLVDTYIVNDNGELRDLYIAICEELDVPGTPKDLFMGKHEWLGLNAECRFIGVYSGGMWISHRCNVEEKELTISDLKPIPTETQEEKEALDAIEQVEWNGEGLPPIGVECEFKYKHSSQAHWNLCKVFAYSNEMGMVAAIWHWVDEKWKHATVDVVGYEFRAIETPEAKKGREELEALILHIERAQSSMPNFHEKSCDHWIATCLINAGYRKGE